MVAQSAGSPSTAAGGQAAPPFPTAAGGLAAPPFSAAAALGRVWLTAGLAAKPAAQFPRPPAGGPGGVLLPMEQQKPGGEDVGAELRFVPAAALRSSTSGPSSAERRGTRDISLPRGRRWGTSSSNL